MFSGPGERGRDSTMSEVVYRRCSRAPGAPRLALVLVVSLVSLSKVGTPRHHTIARRCHGAEDTARHHMTPPPLFPVMTRMWWCRWQKAGDTTPQKSVSKSGFDTDTTTDTTRAYTRRDVKRGAENG